MSNSLEKIHYFGINWLSEHDGAGKRLVLFLQGCNLDCLWCHSPHSQTNHSPLLFFENLCQNCQQCLTSCPNSAHSFLENRHLIDRSLCLNCGKCIEACPQSSFYKSSGALVLPTKKRVVKELFEDILPQLSLLKDIGGITFSGGEPLLQPKAVKELAILCQKKGFHTTLENSGAAPLANLKLVADHIDSWLIGVRLTTGTSSFKNEELEKKCRLSLDYLLMQKGVDITLRVPVIPGFTDNSKYLSRLKKIIDDYKLTKIDILPHNPESAHYYQALNLTPLVSYNSTLAHRSYQTIFNDLNNL